MSTVLMLALMWDCSRPPPGMNDPHPSIGFWGYVFDPSYDLDAPPQGQPRYYIPQAGDVFLGTDSRFFWAWGYWLVGSGHPHHSGTVFQRSNGEWAVLEAGPHDTRWIRTFEAYYHLSSYQDQPGGRVWIRQRKCPLTPEQSARLTEWAEMQDGKHFAGPRMFWQLTHIRTKNPLLLNWFGKPHGPDKLRYYCCELGLEAGVYAGYMDPETTRPLATWPHELFLDHSKNAYLDRHPPLKDCWYPPARWLKCLPEPAGGEPDSKYPAPPTFQPPPPQSPAPTPGIQIPAK